MLKSRRKHKRTSTTTRRKRVRWGGEIHEPVNEPTPPEKNSIFSSITESVSSIFKSKPEPATPSIQSSGGKHIIVVYEADINNVPSVLPKPKIYSGDFQVEKYTEVSM